MSMKKRAPQAKRKNQRSAVFGALISRSRYTPAPVHAVIARESLVRVPRRHVENNEKPNSYFPFVYSLPSKTATLLLLLYFICTPVAHVHGAEELIALVPRDDAASFVPSDDIDRIVSPISEPTSSSAVSLNPLQTEVAEAVAESPETTVESTVEQVPPASPEVGAALLPVVAEAGTTTLTQISIELTPIEPVTTTVDTTSSSSAPSLEEGATTGGDVGVSSASSTSRSNEEMTATTTGAEVVNENVLPPGTTTSPTIPQVAAGEVSTTPPRATTTTPREAPLVLSHTTDAEKFTFTATECVPVGGGAFHCVKSDQQKTSLRSTSEPVYASRDQGGDLEIYESTESGPRAISDNNFDDDAPSKDVLTEDVVWQSLIDDRYQISHYHKKTGDVVQVTKEAYNSMQPAINDGDIVMQSWIGSDWDIVLIAKDGMRTILTDNDVHDIAPSITREFIMWQSHENDTWVGKVYDRSTKEVTTVKGLDGGKMENPRMVMVFDTKMENGDVETVGYDPETGDVVPLVATPVPLPERIPDPEPTPEEKAFVQSSSTTPRIETRVGTTTGMGNDPQGDGGESVSTLPAATSSASVGTSTPIEPVTSSVSIPSGTPSASDNVVSSPQDLVIAKIATSSPSLVAETPASTSISVTPVRGDLRMPGGEGRVSILFTSSTTTDRSAEPALVIVAPSSTPATDNATDVVVPLFGTTEDDGLASGNFMSGDVETASTTLR
jgi:hypothetical protein